jgi:imidazolonepropionase-like amidohydrolase
MMTAMSRAILGLTLALLLMPSAAAQQPARTLAITHVNVVDVGNGSVSPDMTVLVDEGTITAVLPAARARVPEGARAVDATGKYLIPGLWDMHVHWYDERFLPLFIANGVTGVRQMWGMPLHFGWRERIDSGALVGPRFSIASTIVDGPDPVWPGSIVVRDAAEARAAVRTIKDAGFDFVKVYEQLSREAYFAIADESRKLGIRFGGHVPPAVTAREASDAGQHSVEHLSGVLLASSTAGDDVAAKLAAIWKAQGGKPLEPAVRTALRGLNERVLASYDEKKAAALFATFARNGTWHCPTLVVLRSMSSLDDAVFTSDARLKYMPRSIRASWVPTTDFRLSTRTPEDYAGARREFRKELEIVGAMHRAGVRLIAGTDVLNPFAFPGFSLHDELALLVQAGLTPLDALRAATVNAAEYLGQGTRRGTIGPGKAADLVLLDANPLENIANTTQIASVVLDGRLVDRRRLDTMLADVERIANLKSIAAALQRTLETEGIEAARAQYADLRRREPDAYDFDEGELNLLGYQLLEKKKVDEAIAIFGINAEAFPQSAYAFDSLAESHMVKGDRERAIQHYRRSLELDPRNSNAADMLKKLGGM